MIKILKIQKYTESFLPTNHFHKKSFFHRFFLPFTEYLKYNRANVIVVDWGGGRTFPTEESVATQVHAVAKKIATLVAKLVLFAHLDLDNTIFVGYSMGAHVMGAAGKILEGLVDTVVGKFVSENLHESIFSSISKSTNEIIDCDQIFKIPYWNIIRRKNHNFMDFNIYIYFFS